MTHGMLQSVTMTPKPIRPKPARPANGPEWERLAEAMIARREELNLSQRAFVRRADISLSGYSPLETVKLGYTPSSKTLRQISTAMGWTKESCQLILDGKPPILAVIAEPEPSETIGTISLDAFGIDVAVLKQKDPEAYVMLVQMARRLALGHHR